MDPSTFFIILLQITFIALKLNGSIAWSWFFVFFPLIVIVIWYVIMLLMIIVAGIFYQSKKEEGQSEFMKKINKEIEKNEQSK